MQNEHVGLKGIYKFTVASLKTDEQWALHNKIKETQVQGGDYIPLVNELNRICHTRVYTHENIIPTVGRTLIANNLTNTIPTNDPFINYSSLGTSSTAVANSDTQLVAEVYRKQIASSTNSSTTGYVTAFYAATDTNGTYREAGLFCNATASANSGVLFSRVLLNAGTGIIKSVTETLTIDYQITIT